MEKELPKYKFGCETICNERDIFPAMREMVENYKFSINAAAKHCHEVSGGQVTIRRAVNVYHQRKSVSHKTPTKAPKKHTKPDTKIQLESVTMAIESGDVADDDIKDVLDSAAKLVSKGEASPRVAAKLATVFQKQTKQKAKNIKRGKGKSNIEKMTDLFHKAVNMLDEICGKGVKSVGKSDKAILNKEFRHLIPRMTFILINMGMDIEEILNLQEQIKKGGKYEKIQKNKTQSEIAY